MANALRMLLVLLCAGVLPAQSPLVGALSALKLHGAEIVQSAKAFLATKPEEKVKDAAKSLATVAKSAADVFSETKEAIELHAASISKDTLVKDVKWLTRYEKNMRAEAQGAQSLIESINGWHTKLDPLLDSCLDSTKEDGVKKTMACLSSVPGRELLNLAASVAKVKSAALAKAEAAKKLRVSLEKPPKPKR